MVQATNHHPAVGRPPSGGRSSKKERQNQLLNLSNEILELATAIHAMNLARSPTGPNGTEQAAISSICNAMGNDQQ
jgi:hypothetical protein